MRKIAERSLQDLPTFIENKSQSMKSLEKSRLFSYKNGIINKNSRI